MKCGIHFVLLCSPPAWSLSPTWIRRGALLRQPTSRTTKLFMETQDNWLESQRAEAKDILQKIEAMQDEIQAMNTTLAITDVELKTASIEAIEKNVDQLMNQLLPPSGLSMDEYVNASHLFLNLPPSARLTFVKALALEDEAAGDFQRIPEIVTRLYEERFSLTQKRLTDALKLARSAKTATNDAESKKTPADADAILTDFFERGTDEVRMESNVKALLPRVTRKEEMRPVATDLDILTSVLGTSTFNPNGRPIEIPGGYVIRGQNRKASGQELIEALDSQLPSEWGCTVSFMYDVSLVESDNIFERTSNALVLLNKDFSPETSVWLYRFVSLSAFITTLLFAVGVFGSNDAILNRLTDASAIGDFSGLDFFNGKVVEILFPLAVILGSHEFGHYLVSKKEKIETASFLPTFLPFWSNLPLLGSLTRINSSPRNKTALFDFAFLGPLLGFISSFIFLGTGLLATKSAVEGGSSAETFLPALPVSVLKLSTLGGSVIDNFFGGSTGYITSQDPATAIQLHPMAIAGFCGLLINAAEMLPLGATDGGRMSLAVFGRQGQSIIGGLTWFFLLIASFSLSEQTSGFLVTAWVINNVVQNDMEVPCRDETDDVNLPRILAVWALWFLAALVIIPMS